MHDALRRWLNSLRCISLNVCISISMGGSVVVKLFDCHRDLWAMANARKHTRAKCHPPTRPPNISAFLARVSKVRKRSEKKQNITTDDKN